MSYHLLYIKSYVHPIPDENIKNKNDIYYYTWFVANEKVYRNLMYAYVLLSHINLTG